MDLVFLKEFESFVVNVTEGEEFNPVFFILKNFLFKLGNVLSPPIVGRPLQSKPNQHLGSLLGRALACVERNNAPWNEIFPP